MPFFFAFLIALVALLVVLPLMLVIFFAILLIDRHWPIFVQVRYGRNGKLVPIYKFRTMRGQNGTSDSDLDSADDLLQGSDRQLRSGKIQKNPRITWLGKRLRESGLDETPNLINVLKGDLTLVGWRPLIPRAD